MQGLGSSASESIRVTDDSPVARWHHMHTPLRMVPGCTTCTPQHMHISTHEMFMVPGGTSKPVGARWHLYAWCQVIPHAHLVTSTHLYRWCQAPHAHLNTCTHLYAWCQAPHAYVNTCIHLYAWCQAPHAHLNTCTHLYAWCQVSSCYCCCRSALSWVELRIIYCSAAQTENALLM